MKNAGAIQEKGIRYTFRLDNVADFQRQVVRGDSGDFKVEDLEVSMPPAPGQLTNLESLFNKVLTDLEVDQPVRKESKPELYKAIAGILDRLKLMIRGEAFPITVSLDDMSGNSFIEPLPSDLAPKYVRKEYFRTHEQNIELGLALEEDSQPTQTPADPLEGVDIVDGEVYEIPAECPACSKACTVNLKKVNIPHFKEVILMATVCDHCGYRTSDVKTGGEIPEKGKRITLKVLNKEDMSRDILKGESCSLRSPELDLEVQPGTLGGRFTTVEGLLSQVRDQLYGQIFDADASTEMIGNLSGGDSMQSDQKKRWLDFFVKLDRALQAEESYQIILEDPLAGSYVQTLKDGDEQVVVEDYERTEVEKEELGLNDMKLENYDNGHSSG